MRVLSAKISVKKLLVAIIVLCVMPFTLAQENNKGTSLINAVPAPKDPAQSFRVLAFHDIQDNLRKSFEVLPEAANLETRQLVLQFSWLKENGYHPVSLQQIIDTRNGKGKLPEKAVLITFDDGYESVYTKAFPLLKAFNYPAVIGLVGSWLETRANQKVAYGNAKIPREDFVTWDEVRTMVDSGLVEVASHTYDLHKGIVANPQGSLFPAAIAHQYDLQKARYESDAEYEKRIKDDLKRNSDLIEHHLHKRPRAMIWPYGRYNKNVVAWAKDAGMSVTMNLEDGPNLPERPLSQIRRTLVGFDAKLPDFIDLLHRSGGDKYMSKSLERVIHLDLDYVYDPDPVQREANLSKLLDRIKRIQPTTVYLQAFADQDGDGVAKSVYFPNRHLPMRADLFSRVAWQLSTRANVKVYAWLPVMAFKLPASDPGTGRVVQAASNTPSEKPIGPLDRLSLFDPLVRKTILEIYDDLGKSSIFDGVLFHDDAVLSDYEDASPMALQYYRDNWQLPASIEAIRKSPELMHRWTEKKTDFIDAFTIDLANKLREYRPDLLTARNLFAQPVLHPESQKWFAQSLPKFLSTYDYTVIMAMPYMEGEKDPNKWLDGLLNKVQVIPGALNKVVFELQSRDWTTGTPVPTATLAGQLRHLHLQGVRNFGYYPDDFVSNHPEESGIKPVISVQSRLNGR